MTYLALDPKRPVTVPEITVAYEVSENYLTKAVRRLARAGVVESIRRNGGDIGLARSPQKIRVGRSTLVKYFGGALRIREYQKLYVIDDVGNFLTRLDMDAASDAPKRSDRLVIEAELVSHFGSLHFTAAALSAAP